MLSLLRRYLMAGLLLWVPILLTFWVLQLIISLTDNIFRLFPQSITPETWIGKNIPGLGLLLSLLILLLTGLFVTNFMGNYFVKLWNRFIDHIPLVRSLYNAIRQVMETVFTSSGNAFRRVLLVEYPRKGLWSIAFQTSETTKNISQATGEENLITIFIPTTPNPTSGFLMMIPQKDAIVLDIGIEQALKFIISLGVVQPATKSELLDQLKTTKK